MPLYRLHCISAHYQEYRHVKDLVTQSAKLLLDNGSPIREIKFLGTKSLPQRMKRHKAYHTIGDYWTMNFDTSPRLLARLNDQMRSDPRVIRWTMLKLGEKLEDVVDERVNLSVSPSDEASDSSTLEECLLALTGGVKGLEETLRVVEMWKFCVIYSIRHLSALFS
ncbi:ribosomal S6 [Pyrrhoderma noxium]|uniref:Ribosomal S6 n=1 Tax=Pyrrhoderma noxium TaxID=2282107 RepID=A0A286UGH0_9AGAM|nr:ribosomal S6 [Pyrrhoderma noxium]